MSHLNHLQYHQKNCPYRARNELYVMLTGTGLNRTKAPAYWQK